MDVLAKDAVLGKEELPNSSTGLSSVEKCDKSLSKSLENKASGLNHEAVRRLVLKQDLFLIPFLSLLYLLSFLDRIAIGNGKIAGLDKDLNLTPSEYNWSLSIFFFPYALCEVPSNILLKRLRPSRWIPSIMVVWGGVMIAMAFVRNFSELMVVRFFLGLAEAGLFPGVVYYITFWYCRREQSFRIALFFCAASIAGAFGGFLAYGIQQMHGLAGLAGWQWIFVIEGGVTVLVALLSYAIIADSPETASWLTSEERMLAMRRLREDSVGNDEGFSWKRARAAFLDPKVYLYMTMYVGTLIPLFSFSLFMPSIVFAMGFSSLEAQLLSSPPYVVGCLATMIVAYISDRYQRRAPFVLIFSLVGVLGYVLLATLTSTAGLYTSLYIVALGFYPVIPVSISWLTNNIAGDTKRGVASAMMISFANLLGGLLGSQLYREQDKPRYVLGHAINAGFMSAVFLFSVVLYFVLRKMNENRERGNCVDISKLTREEIEDLGDRHPNFRYML
ncbi:uncharacterized protein VTP21DRAFT_2298 [Calcarisporiella thermophila]|uniref:uncharacterized protein n=1 Tax=Calcarisporiella thermophila TaxID=911321 RepID=UPI003743D3E4